MLVFGIFNAYLDEFGGKKQKRAILQRRILLQWKKNAFNAGVRISS